MKMLSMRVALAALMLLGVAEGARAEMFKCLQADGGLSFQQLPCADGVPGPAEVTRPASPAAAPRAPDPASPIPTRRMREVLDLTHLSSVLPMAPDLAAGTAALCARK